MLHKVFNGEFRAIIRFLCSGIWVLGQKLKFPRIMIYIKGTGSDSSIELIIRTPLLNGDCHCLFQKLKEPNIINSALGAELRFKVYG